MFIHEDFFSLTRTVEGQEHGTTSTLQAVFFSAALGSKATLSLASRASSRAHARFGGHAASRWWSPPVTFANHSTSHDSSRTSRTPVVAPHVPTLISSTAGLSFTHRPRLLFLHIQTHLASKHDGLQGEKQDHYRGIQNWIFPPSVSQPTSFTGLHTSLCISLKLFVKHSFVHIGLTWPTDSVSLPVEKINLLGCVQIN